MCVRAFVLREPPFHVGIHKVNRAPFVQHIFAQTI